MKLLKYVVNIINNSKNLFITGPVEDIEVPIDPVKLKKLKILSGEGPVSMNTTLSKAVISGLADTVFVSATYVFCLK